MSGERIVVAALGDSITAGTPAWDPDPGVRARIKRPDETSSWPYWAAKSNQGLTFRVSAVDGERTDEIALRLVECANGADVLVVQGGINDLVQSRTPEDAADNLRAMVRCGKKLGCRVAVTDVLPWNKGYPEYEAPIRLLNQLIYRLAQGEGVVALLFHDTLEDRQRPGHMREEWTADGSHPSPAGHRRLGELAFRLP